MTVDITAAVGKISKSYAEKYVAVRASVLAGVSYGDETRFLSEERFTSGVGILYLLYLVILIAFYIFRKTLILVLGKLCLALCPKCCCRGRDHIHAEEARDQELAAGLDTFSRDFLADLRMETLADKYRKAVVDFHDAQQYEVAEVNMMNQELKDGLLDILKRRLRWIESAIDAHVDSLIEEKIIQPRVNMQEFFALRDKSYERKLHTLLQCEADLIERKDRLKKPCLRMKGIT